MARFRAILGIVAGVMLILSSAAHSLLGWKSLGAQLASAQVPPELLINLKVAWMFGGMTMLVPQLRKGAGVSGGNREFDTVVMGRGTYEVGLPEGLTSP